VKVRVIFISCALTFSLIDFLDNSYFYQTISSTFERVVLTTTWPH